MHLEGGNRRNGSQCAEGGREVVNKALRTHQCCGLLLSPSIPVCDQQRQQTHSEVGLHVAGNVLLGLKKLATNITLKLSQTRVPQDVNVK